MADGIFLRELTVPNSIAVQENTVFSAERNGIIVDASKADAFFYTGQEDGEDISAFAGNKVEDGAVSNGDDFAFQGSNTGFNEATISTLMESGRSYVDPTGKTNQKLSPCSGSFANNTDWPTAKPTMAAAPKE